MTKNLKMRIYTSLLLFLLLCIMFVNNFVLGYVLLIAGMSSLLEFFNIIILAFKKNKFKKILINFLFIIYIFTFCAFFFIFSVYIHLKIIIFSILLTCTASDIGGFIFGKIFKGPKLSSISPNKTISGSLGSIIFSSFFLSIITFYATKNFEIYIFITAIVTSITCQIGDLLFSYIKRKAQIKDTGKFLPGHGGILDRIDGMIFAFPASYLILSLNILYF